MFMALEPLTGLRVVDLFAGSGALGIEALSRGAAFADMVEPAHAARRALMRNLEALELRDRSHVWRVTLPGGLHALAEALRAADLVLADPPYGGREASAILAALGRPGMLRPGSRVVLEHHAKDEVPERAGSLACLRRRAYGETVVSTYGAQEQPPSSEEESLS
jgi:16S rRNA (guanine966-N2)-methyltransferase